MKALMDRLPQELHSLILSFVERYEYRKGARCSNQQLPRLATVSRKWQYTVERLTFERITVRSDKLPEFQIIYTAPRRHMLKWLTYNVVLPVYDDDACARSETEAEKRANDEVFTRAIQNLFSILKSWEDASLQAHSQPITLSLHEIFSPMDGYYGERKRYEERRFLQFVGKRQDLFEDRYIHSRIHLLDTLELPTLRRVSCFENSRINLRMIDYRAVIDIAAKCQSLQEIRLDLYDNEEKYLDLRARRRHDFADALQNHTFPNLKAAAMEFYFEHSNDLALHGPNLLLSEGLFCDPLSTALRKLSQNLVTLSLDGVIDSTLFWPYESGTSRADDYPSWPFLQRLEVRFSMTAPSGEWYFILENSKVKSHNGRDQLFGANNEPSTALELGEDSDNPVSFPPDRVADSPSIVPNPETLPYLLSAFARAAQHMPVLQLASLSAIVQSNDPDITSHKWAVSYWAPGVACYLEQYVDAPDPSKRRVNWEVQKWRPSEEVRAPWQSVGRDKYGGELMEEFLEIEY